MKQSSLETNFTLLFRHSYQRSALWFLATAALSLVWLLGHTDCAAGKPPVRPDFFATLKTRLVKDGFDKSLIRSLYSKPGVTFDQRGVSAYFLHREATLNYNQFLTRSSIGQAIDYLGRHQKTLKRAQGVYGVDEEVITAIILVESRLGTSIGKRLIFNTLSALAALDNKNTRDGLWHSYLKNKTKESRRRFDTWASRKSAWAYSELKAYLKYVKVQDIDPLSIRGSYAGALGISQFVPSSVLRFAQDGNRDGRIDLYDHEDAIESIANYLKQHGWRPSLKRREEFRILLSYNQSKYYANTILNIAERLAKLRTKVRTN